MNSIFLWANTILLLSCMTFYLEFTANLAAFILGVPFIVIIVINIKDHRKSFLMKGITRLQKGEDIQHYITYFQHIIDTRGNFHNLIVIDESRDAAMTLKGYVNHHSEFCQIDDCPLRNFKKQMQKDQKKSYSQFGSAQVQTIYSALSSKNQVTNLESHPLLISQVKNLYQNGIKKFPQCVPLKIDFAQFLLHKMHNRKDALKELINAEKQSPNLEHQFQIFRLRQIIEDELHEGADSAGGLDYVAAINFENHFNQFKNYIERSALLHYEFWNHLMDDSPDLAKLCEQGSRINASIQSVEDQWKKLTQQSTQTPKALRMYASYLIDILNDKEMGNEQLQKAKEAAVIRAALNFDLNNMHEDTSDMSSFAPDGSPCIYISAEQDRLGYITQCNMSACRAFGYSKKENLINQEIEILMPRIYAKHHKKFLEAAIQKPPDLLSSKERQLFGKHSSGFIFPIQLSVKNLPSFLSGRQFVGTMKLEKNGINKNVAHLLLDKNKDIVDISASCIGMLDLDLNKFQKLKAKFDISLLMPTLFGNSNFQFQNKTGFQIEYQFPKLVEMDKNEIAQMENQPDYEDQNPDDQDPNAPQSSMNLNRQNLNQYDISIVEEEEDALLSNEDIYGRPSGGTKEPMTPSIFAKRNKLMSAVEKIDEVDDEDSEEEYDSQERLEKQNKVYQYKVVASDKTAIFQCYSAPIQFENLNLDNQNAGYFVKMETSLDKQGGSAKIQKIMKQNNFQFSYDPIYKRFYRELRDKDNKDFLIDKNYLAMKKLRETYVNQIQTTGSSTVPEKIQTMSYLSYLQKCQKWQERGQQGNILDDNSDGLSSHDSIDDKDIDESPKKNSEAVTPNNNSLLAPQANQNIFQMANSTNFLDLKKFLPMGEGSSKEFLKNEVERMINDLRKKQEIGDGIKVFRRQEPGQRQSHAYQNQSSNHPGLGQEGRYEEAPYSLAGLFASRSSDRMTSDSLDDDHEMRDDDERGSDKNKSSGGSSDMKNQIKSRKAFQMAINDKSVPPAIQRLSRIANFLLLCLITIAVVDYSISFKQLKDTVTNFEVIVNSYERIAEIQKVCYNVRSLIMLNQNVLTSYNYEEISKDEYIQEIQSDLQKSLNQLYDIQNQINLAQLDVSSEHSQLLDEKSVQLYFKQELGSMKSLTFSLTESILQIQSSIFIVSNLNVKDFSELTNEDVFFLMYNSFNELHIQMLRSSNLYVQELRDRSQEKSEIQLILLILSIVALTLLVILLFPVVTSVNQQKDKVLSLFCEIEDSNIRLLSAKCEKFLCKLQSADDNGNGGEGQDEGMLDSNDEMENLQIRDSGKDEDEYTPASMDVTGKRKKNAKNKTKTQKLFYVKFVMAMLVCEAYFSYNYGAMREYTDLTQIQLNELNLTTNIEPFFWFSLNTQREMFYNSSKPILNRPSFSVAEDSLYMMYDLIDVLQATHLQNEAYLSEEYWNDFHSRMTEDLCPDLIDDASYFKDVDKCRQFSSGIAEQGMSLMLMNYIRVLRLQLAQSQINKSNQTLQVSIINSKEMFELFIIQHKFTQSNMRSLIETFSSSITDQLNDRLQRRLFLLILFLILLLLAYVSVWLPLVNSLNNQIYKTKLMLMIIPLEILMRMKNVGKVLQSQNFIHEKQFRMSGGSQPSTQRKNAKTTD